jgi:hypothetical protein
VKGFGYTPVVFSPEKMRETNSFQSEQLFPVSLYVMALQWESENALVVAERRYNLDYEMVTRTSNTEQENRGRKVIYGEESERQ